MYSRDDDPTQHEGEAANRTNVLMPLCQRKVREKGLPHNRKLRECRYRARHCVTVRNNPEVKPLAATNYDTRKIEVTYLLCGTHRNSFMRQFKNTPADIWYATSEELGRNG